MIKNFNEDVEARTSAVIYNSTFEQIKKMYLRDPLQAGELAISAIELALTGQFSSDDYVIDLALTTMSAVVEKDKEKYERECERKRQGKIEVQRLDRIAELYWGEHKTQKEIAEIINRENQEGNLRQPDVTQQTISNRIGLIKTEFTDLYKLYKFVQLVPDNDTDTVNDTVTDNVNDNDTSMQSGLETPDCTSPLDIDIQLFLYIKYVFLKDDYMAQPINVYLATLESREFREHLIEQMVTQDFIWQNYCSYDSAINDYNFITRWVEQMKDEDDIWS